MAHERLGERLTRLELGRGFRWTEHAQTFAVEHVGDAGGQRVFRADDDQPDVLFFREADQPFEVVGDRFEGDVYAVERCAAVAGGAENVSNTFGLTEFPYQRVF